MYETVLSQDVDHDDEQLLKKLRGLYNSCMNEDLLNARGATPLVRVVKKLRDLFTGKTTIVDAVTGEIKALEDESENENDKKGLTAAVAYLHSRGGSINENADHF